MGQKQKRFSPRSTGSRSGLPQARRVAGRVDHQCHVGAEVWGGGAAVAAWPVRHPGRPVPAGHGGGHAAVALRARAEWRSVTTPCSACTKAQRRFSRSTDSLSSVAHAGGSRVDGVHEQHHGFNLQPHRVRTDQGGRGGEAGTKCQPGLAKCAFSSMQLVLSTQRRSGSVAATLGRGLVVTRIERATLPRTTSKAHAASADHPSDRRQSPRIDRHTTISQLIDSTMFLSASIQ